MEPKFQGRPLDTVVFIIGGEAAGKSTFINYILDEIGHPLDGDNGERMEVRSGLAQCTRSIHPVRLTPMRGECQSALGRVVLVDGPCLADNDIGQHNKIVSDAKEWLSKHYPPSMTPNLGIIYIQDISMCPLTSVTIHLNLKVPGKLSDAIGCGHILLVTTKWENLRPEDVSTAEMAAYTWPKIIPTTSLAVHKVEKGGHSTQGPSALAALRHFMGEFDALSPGCGLKNDVLILVIGPIKAGKSTFINAILRLCDQAARMQVNSSLSLTTLSVSSAVLRSHPFSESNVGPSRRVILVDTPGFVGDDREDNAILRSIKAWYDTRFQESQPVSCCIVYLHDISQDNFALTAERVLNALPGFIREISLKDVSIVSTKWDRSFGHEGERREEQLSTEFWPRIFGVQYKVCRILYGEEGFGGPASNHGNLLRDMLKPV